MRILVVEDERRVASFVCRALRENAYAVDLAETGEKALETELLLARPRSAAGIGIAKEDLPRIFERFFRAAPSNENQSGGLGLAIAQAVVVAHNGRIECESEPGTGSVFVVRLPLSAR